MAAQPRDRRSKRRPASSRPSGSPSASRRQGGGRPRTHGGGEGRRRLTSRAVILLAVVVLLMASYASSLHAWWQQRVEIETKRAEIVRLQDDIDEIDREFTRWEDPAYVEQQARERFGWVMPGEVGYKVIGIDGEVKGASPELSAPEPAREPTWYQKLWGSVEEAGKPPAQKKREREGPSPDTVLEETE